MDYHHTVFAAGHHDMAPYAFHNDRNVKVSSDQKEDGDKRQSNQNAFKHGRVYLEGKGTTTLLVQGAFVHAKAASNASKDVSVASGESPCVESR